MENLDYEERIYTRAIVDFLIEQRDQVATTEDIADKFMVSKSCARRGLARLRKVGRVDEIRQDWWHLE
jgi:Mn-dependent DtxR family transcriptional regulator